MKTDDQVDAKSTMASSLGGSETASTFLPKPMKQMPKITGSSDEHVDVSSKLLDDGRIRDDNEKVPTTSIPGPNPSGDTPAASDGGDGLSSDSHVEKSTLDDNDKGNQPTTIHKTTSSDDKLGGLSSSARDDEEVPLDRVSHEEERTPPEESPTRSVSSLASVFEGFGDLSNVLFDTTPPVCPSGEVRQFPQYTSFPEPSLVDEWSPLLHPNNEGHYSLRHRGWNNINSGGVQSILRNNAYLVPRPRYPSSHYPPGTVSGGLDVSDRGLSAYRWSAPDYARNEGRDELSEYDQHIMNSDPQFMDPLFVHGEVRDNASTLYTVAQPTIANDPTTGLAPSAVGSSPPVPVGQSWKSTGLPNDKDNEIKSNSSTPGQVSVEFSANNRKFQRWTREEDDTLREAVEIEGGPPYHWKRIARQYFSNRRNPSQCKSRWTKALKPGLVRGAWSPEEDKQIRIMRSRGMKWSLIAVNLPGRIGEQVRDRYVNVLDPGLKRTPWTPEENRILLLEQRKVGNRWAEIAKFLPGRSENSIKNRWHNAKMTQRRRLRSQAVAQSREDQSAGAHSNDTSPKKAKRGKKIENDSTPTGISAAHHDDDDDDDDAGALLDLDMFFDSIMEEV